MEYRSSLPFSQHPASLPCPEPDDTIRILKDILQYQELRRIFCPKRDEVTGDWRRLHNEELHSVYSSPNIIRMIKSRRMRWAGHVARMGRRGMHVGYWLGSRKERDH
jgi:hypothetical protein